MTSAAVRPSPSEDGEGPAERLAATAAVQRVPTRLLDLFVLRGFLSDADCAALIERIETARRPSTVADDLGDPLFRTSETCDMDSGDPLVASVEQRIAQLLGLPLELGEPLQGQRYAAGQEFKLHTDTFEPTGLDYHLHCGTRGQRSWTAMIYLNRPAAGGATRFKTIAKTIQPETGKLIAWNNLGAAGRPNPATLHQGMKVRQGVKYVLTKWFRTGSGS